MYTFIHAHRLGFYFCILQHLFFCDIILSHSCFVPANGDDNLVMGLSIDRVSLPGKVLVRVGFEDTREVSPYCILVCLTLEGELIMFQFSRYCLLCFKTFFCYCTQGRSLFFLE